jgi:hypothetical protein
MLRKLRPQLTYANVASTLALVLAVGGGSAYAASKIRTRNISTHAVTASKVAFNAITASKVRNSSLSGKDVRNGTIRSGDVDNGTLRSEDFAAGQLPPGPKGEKGDPATSIFGMVSAAGALTGGKGVIAVSTGGPGVYAATFGQDVSKCAVVATVSGSAPASVTAQPNAAATQQITFRTFDATNALADLPFAFAVSCP